MIWYIAVFLHQLIAKKTGNAEETEENLQITTEKIILRAIERGLSLKDFEEMTVGMIIDFIVTYNNENLTDEEKEAEVRNATQDDYDRW